MADGDGTRDRPWVLDTPSGGSGYTAYRDDVSDPPALVVQVGTTELRYQLRCVDDLQAMLREAGDWVPLGSADEQKPAKPGTVEAWARADDNPVGGWYGLKKGLRGRFANYVPPVMERLGLAEVEHNARNNRMRAAAVTAAARDPFEALGDPHRRAIVELLADGGRSVGEVADALPISRPAVSRHLRLLKEAGLVVEEPQGTRRIYRLHDEGVEAVEAFLAQVWGDAVTRFRILAENTAPRGRPPPLVTLDPLRLTYRIECPPEHAFSVWTTRLSAWWPRSHTTSGDPDAAVVLEPRLGGRIFERATDGREIDWGEITAWEPPARFEYRWHIGRNREDATDVSVAFVDAGDGATRLEIVHSGWDRLGADGVQFRRANTTGWDGLIPDFRAAAEA